MSKISIAFKNVKSTSPLIHCLTNYVTVNDVANVLLAAGAAPIMADDITETAEITAICTGLYINIGTLNERAVASMIATGKKANELGRPVVLDPVGAGASKLRTDTVLKLIKDVKFTAIRGNISEIKTIALGTNTTQGVDAAEGDKIRLSHLTEDTAFIKTLSKQLGTVIVVTGEHDIVTDGERQIVIHNGHAMMKHVTGTGCQLGAVLTAFVAANKDDAFTAAVSAVSGYGLCGQIAYDRLLDKDGNSTYRNYIIDALFNLTPQKLTEGANYEDY